jgi:hypothetical protein
MGAALRVGVMVPLESWSVTEPNRSPASGGLCLVLRLTTYREILSNFHPGLPGGTEQNRVCFSETG